VQSVLWDIAGAAVEWQMTDRALAILLEELSSRFGIATRLVPLTFHRAGYCCLRLAEARQLGDEASARRYDSGLRAALMQLNGLR
jgi:hypothetical protein